MKTDLLYDPAAQSWENIRLYKSNLLSYVSSSTIRNREDMETTEMPIRRGTDKDTVLCVYALYYVYSTEHRRASEKNETVPFYNKMVPSGDHSTQ